MRTPMAAASSAKGAASKKIKMAAFMRSGYAIRARAIVRILRGPRLARAIPAGPGPATNLGIA